MSAIREEVQEHGVVNYLNNQQNKSLLRFLACGSVDDGKSTLIGRLLHDSHQLYDDQLTTLHAENEKQGNAGQELDFSLLVDGLQAEREQGITIDVAYRYFSTKTRKFIIADTPGHEQYTRNMATGASTCDLAIILIDARHGVQAQTRRHSYICSQLGIKQFVVAINKMDLVNYSSKTFNDIVEQYQDVVQQLGLEHVHFVPISALRGENLIERSAHMPWYQQETLMELLELADESEQNLSLAARLPVQYVNRPDSNYRGFSGTLASGILRPGDAVTVQPSGLRSVIKTIDTFDGELDAAEAGEAITVTLTDEIDISRGDVLIAGDESMSVSKQFNASLVWLNEAPLRNDAEYRFKIGHRVTTGKISAVNYVVNVNDFSKETASGLVLNSIANVDITLTEAVALDEYQQLRKTGSFIVIDRLSNATVAAGMVQQTELDNTPSTMRFSQQELELNAYIRKHYPHWQAIDISTLPDET